MIVSTAHGMNNFKRRQVSLRLYLCRNTFRACTCRMGTYSRRLSDEQSSKAV